MPGYYVHFAACGGEALKNRSFVLGVEAPDLLKTYHAMYGLRARAKYDILKTGDMPEYDELLPRILQKETPESDSGLHYGVSSEPNVMSYWDSLADAQKANPFYRGYAWHLLSDAVVYSWTGITEKMRELAEKSLQVEDVDAFWANELDILHKDWNKMNALIKIAYPEVTMPREVKDLDVVKFLRPTDFTYLEWESLRLAIDFLRSFDPLTADMGWLISSLM